MVKHLVLFFSVIAVVLCGYFVFRLSNGTGKIPVSRSKEFSIQLQPSSSPVPEITVLAERLDTPWGLAFLPDKSMLVTERPGRVRLIDSGGGLRYEPVATLLQVKEIGEGGLLGIAVHPEFLKNAFVYLYYTYSENGGDTLNRVVRMKYQKTQLSDERVIVDNIPGAANHNGGRIAFGPDGYLYITTGDAQDSSKAQDTETLGGKILRVTDEGKPAQGNPFDNLVYSYGHRNPQGIAWDGNGQLWATEHGRSGVLSGLDELNRIERGKNYGWPVIQGEQAQEGMETPFLHSGPFTTWAPAGAAFVGNSVFFGGLRGKTLYEAVIEGDTVTLKEHYAGKFGRVRDVVRGPDNFLYITTSNKDGRGEPEEVDDRVLRIYPNASM